MENKGYVTNIQPLEDTKIWQTFGKGKRLELENGAFPIEKLSFGFQTIDMEEKKQTGMIRIYLDFGVASLFAHNILNGEYERLQQKQAQQSSTVPSVFKSIGGSKKVTRPDGRPTFRKMELSKGTLWILHAEEGPGQISSTGGFVAAGPAENRISIGLSDDQLKMMALAIERELLAYRTAQFVRFAVVK